MTSTIEKFLNESVEVKLIEDIVTDQYEEVEKQLQARVNALGATLLYWATCVGNLDCISTLLDLGADIGATTLNRETPLHFAAQCGQVEAAVLLGRGADVQAADLRERTALHAAIEKGGDNHLVVPWLIEKGTDVLEMDINGRTAKGCTRGSEEQNITTLLKQIAGNSEEEIYARI